MTNRDYFEQKEYEALVKTIEQMAEEGVKVRGVQEGEKHTLYSLRHTSIMYRLLLGKTSTLELARNARTSVQMIEQFYASSLDGEMNVAMIQSRRPGKLRKI